MAFSHQDVSDLLHDPELTVADVMRTDFRSCNSGTPLTEVLTALQQSRSRVLPVTQAQIPIGIVTEQALAAAMSGRGANLSGLTAHDLMAVNPRTIEISRPLSEAVRRLADGGGRLLAVNSDGLLKGIVTLAELRPQLTDSTLVRLVTQLISGGDPNLGFDDPRPASPPAVAAREIDPTAETESSKAQSQPHPWDSPTGAHPEPVPLVTPSDLINPLLKVSDVMTSGPRTCSPSSTALEAALVFRDANCGVIPVTDAGRPVGVVTDRSLALALADHEADLAGTALSELMTPDPVTIGSDAPLSAAVDSLGEHGIRRLLVVDDDGVLAGVLSWRDLVPHLSDRGLGHVISRIVDHR